MKKFFSLLLAIAMLAALSLPALAQEDSEGAVFTVSSAEDWLALCRLCRLDSASKDLSVTLERDISLKGFPNAELPTFAGSFDGKGHTISGLTIDHAGSVCALVRYVQEGAVIQNLKLKDFSICPESGSDCTAALAGVNDGLILNCSAEAAVTGKSRTAVLVGSNGVTGEIRDCASRGFVTGTAQTGGICGENLGRIYTARNEAAVNTTAEDAAPTADALRLGLISGPAALVDTADIGGIAGFSGGVIRGCTNVGSIGYPRSGYNVGGIAGRSNGVILECTNEAAIQGRKECAGIAGQMEPSSTLVFTEDTLQKVRKQAVSMQGSVNQALRDVSSASAAMQEGLYDLRDDLNGTVSAVDSLLKILQDEVEIEDGIAGFPSVEIRDADAVRAAANNVSRQLEKASASASAITASGGDGIRDTVGDVQVVAAQMNAIMRLLGASDTPVLGEDVSGLDVEDDGAGKVALCTNRGTVEADINAGGIVGAVARENDLDPEDDFAVEGDRSANFSFRSRAVIHRCVNEAEITIAKRSGGGIVGQLRMGKILGCENRGTIENSGSYTGGIVGRADGSIESSCSKCSVSGKDYVGGIAGFAGNLTRCVFMGALQNDGAYTGAIAGKVPEDAELAGNVFLASEDWAGVDGISYAEKAEPVSHADILEIEGISDYFEKVYVTFTARDKIIKTMTLDYGRPLKEIPPVPQEEGLVGYWEDFEAGEITRDIRVNAVYEKPVTVLEARQGQLHLLVEGRFTPGQSLTLTDGTLTIPDDGNAAHILRIRAEGNDGAEILVNGEVRKTDFTRDGSYLLASVEGNTMTVRTVPGQTGSGFSGAVIAGLAVPAAAAVLLLLKKRKKKQG